MSKNGKGKPDKTDARILLHLYEAQAMHQIGEAMGYIWSNDFPTEFAKFREKFPQGSNSSQERNMWRVLSYFETVGTLYRNSLINEDLLFDWLAVDLLWERVKSWVEGARAETGSARMFENFEYTATKNAKWEPKR